MYENMVLELRKAADEWRAKHPSVSTFETRYDLALFDAANAIEERCQQVDKFAEEAERLYATQPKWIPVKERLPDSGTQIIVCKKLRNGQYWIDVCRFANNLHELDDDDFPNEIRPGFCCYDNEYGWAEITDVTHWMPLPEPPKEET